jgi:hypothetical protein
LLALAGVEFAAIPRAEISEAAAPVTRAVEKTRLLMIMISLPSRMGGLVWLHNFRDEPFVMSHRVCDVLDIESVFDTSRLY